MYEYLRFLFYIVYAELFYGTNSNNVNSMSTNVTDPAIYKVLGLYILLPILAIYTVILYGYLIKIIATWELPNGWSVVAGVGA